MSIEIKVPTLGESITEATVSKWLKKEGEKFDIDEPLVEIETDKITLEVSAPSAGILEKINVDEGTNVNVGGVLGLINESNVSNIKNVNKKEKVEEPKKLNDNIYSFTIGKKNCSRTKYRYIENYFI